MRLPALTIALSLSLISACSKKSEDKQDTAAAKGTEHADKHATHDDHGGSPAQSDGGQAVKAAGVEPGGIDHGNEGPAAVLTAVSGTVQVRRVGEPDFQAAKADDKLYPGDAVRTQDASTATIGLADSTVVELAEVSTVGIASRDGSADPASSAAVLAGLARFTVAQRSPGEGAFKVYTPAGVVITKGTVYGVGVSASGETRVGVESGTVQAIGLADLDLPGATIDGGSTVTLKADGTVSAPDTWAQDDWGTWRDQTDARVDIATAIDAHAKAMAALQKELEDSYVALDASADSVASFEASAADWARANDEPAYQAALPEASANIDASFAVGGRLEALTWANAGHGELAGQLYLRHPDVVEPRWAPIAPRVDAAVLWPKRFEVTATGYLQPLRGAYYLHHPRGRVHAPLVGVSVPVFYAQVEPPPLERATVRAHVKVPVWSPPDIEYRVDAASRPVWIEAPTPNWRADVRIIPPAPPRANVAWYVRPPSLKAKVFVGADVRGRLDSRLVVRAPEPRATLRARWKVPVGVKIKIGAPDLAAAATARARWQVGAPGVRVRAKVDVPEPPDVRGKVDAKVKVGIGVPAPPRVEIKAPAVRIKAGMGAAAGADTGGGVRGGASAGVRVKVKVPSVKVVVPKPPPPPKVKVKAGVKIKAGFGIGN